MHIPQILKAESINMRVSSACRLAEGLSLLRLMWPNWKSFPKCDSWKDTSASLPRPLYKSLIKVFVADTRIALAAQLVVAELIRRPFHFPAEAPGSYITSLV